MNLTSLKQFYKIRDAKKTFLEVANHERKENIYSDLLAFFLKPNEAHKLGVEVLTALVKLAKPDFEVISPKSVYVGREFYTLKDNRIDLFIHTGDYVIGIENKIYQGLQNDLIDYTQTLESYAPNKDKVIKIILALSNDNIKKNDDWQVITYKEFFEKILEIVGLEQSPYSDYLYQLIDSIKSLDSSRFSKQDNEILEKLSVYKIELIKLQQELKEELEKELKEELEKELKEELEKSIVLKKELKKWVTWGEKESLSEGCSIYYNQFDDPNVQVYAYFTVKESDQNDNEIEIEWHVGLQLDGNIKSGKVSLGLFKLFYEKSSELPKYEYTGNGRAGKYKVFYDKNMNKIAKELLTLKKLVELALKKEHSTA